MDFGRSPTCAGVAAAGPIPELQLLRDLAGGPQAADVGTGLGPAEEWDSGELKTPGLAVPRVLRAADVDAVLAKGTSVEREPALPPAFAVGERVRTREMHPSTHTRLPRYARGRVGVIERIQGHHVLADANAHRGLQEPKTPEMADWLYSVRFEAQTLWGESADPHATVNLDLWQVHLLKLD